MILGVHGIVGSPAKIAEIGGSAGRGIIDLARLSKDNARSIKNIVAEYLDRNLTLCLTMRCVDPTDDDFDHPMTPEQEKIATDIMADVLGGSDSEKLANSGMLYVQACNELFGKGRIIDPTKLNDVLGFFLKLGKVIRTGNPDVRFVGPAMTGAPDADSPARSLYSTWTEWTNTWCDYGDLHLHCETHEQAASRIEEYKASIKRSPVVFEWSWLPQRGSSNRDNEANMKRLHETIKLFGAEIACYGPYAWRDDRWGDASLVDANGTPTIFGRTFKKIAFPF